MSFSVFLETLLLGPLKLVFENILVIAERLLDDPGLAIIALSLMMNMLVLPLYRRADAVQEAARDIDQKLQKGVTHIKKVFTGDERMMILQTYYRQNNYRPTDALNGSVSLLLEIPFFMAAYQTLSNLEMFDETGFGPIVNLGQPDGLLVIGSLAINLLPVLMTLINLVSSAIYLTGYPRKAKLQLYGMALFFLVFLYNSPSCLVLYWTLNNLFSLVKNIFCKLKNPRNVLFCLASALGLLVLAFGVFFYHPLSTKRKLFVIGVGIALQLPLLWLLVQDRLPQSQDEGCFCRKNFLLGCLFLTLLTGLFIPSTYIAASAQEFVDITNFQHPAWYLVSSLSYSAGTFMVWMQVFYWLASDKGKLLFDRIVFILCGACFVTYMFFGTKLGIISPALKYEEEFGFAMTEQLVNLIVLFLLAVVLYLLVRRFPKAVGSVLLVSAIALGSMSAMNTVTIFRSVSQIPADHTVSYEPENPPGFSLSKTGKNVVILMLDRGMGHTVPFIMKENPQLQEQFSGFTYYGNTISYGYYTNFGVPAMIGGYEYTPVEMNKRSNEFLVDKHNEALKVLPVLFSQNAYSVTVCDPPYANYRWIPDLSIYGDYPQIQTYITQGIFSDQFQKQQEAAKNHRNFFCFSVMKCLPLCLQSTIYCDGTYNQPALDGNRYLSQMIHDLNTAEGIRSSFMDSYNTLDHLSTMTRITDDDTNTFLFMNNDLTHEPMMLQAPDYVPSYLVDNSQYYSGSQDYLQIDDKTLRMENIGQMVHYQTNAAALRLIGNWLDYLRTEGVYDNTRIIIVADHGNDMGQLDQLFSESGETLEGYFPLLMVKDFNSTAYTVSDEFMTNADVPALAVEGLIDHAVNPFTGKPITNDEKTAHDQFIIMSSKINLSENNGTTFLPDRWASVKENIWDSGNWSFYEEETVLQEHAFPGTP